MSQILLFFQDQILGMRWLNELIGSILTSIGLNIDEKIGGMLHFFIYDSIKIFILLSVLIYKAAAFLGIKVSYLHKLMMRRVIPYYKPNGKLCFFDKAELAAWMKNVRIASQTELDQQAQAYIVNRAKGGKP